MTSLRCCDGDDCQNVSEVWWSADKSDKSSSVYTYTLYTKVFMKVLDDSLANIKDITSSFQRGNDVIGWLH